VFLAFAFGLGVSGWRTVREGLEKQGAFFIDLLWGKQVLKMHKIPQMGWGALDWVGETTSTLQ
jgi:hypothetical protein